jgi:hypothetical protein
LMNFSKNRAAVIEPPNRPPAFFISAIGLYNNRTSWGTNSQYFTKLVSLLEFKMDQILLNAHLPSNWNMQACRSCTILCIQVDYSYDITHTFIWSKYPASMGIRQNFSPTESNIPSIFRYSDTCPQLL